MKSSGSKVVFGNLRIERTEGGCIQLTLNTFSKGRPYALFTAREIPTLIEELRAAAREPEDADGSHLI